MNVLLTQQFQDNKYFVKPADGFLIGEEIFNAEVVPSAADFILFLDYQLFTAHGMTQAGHRMDFFFDDMLIKTMEKSFKPMERVKGDSTAFEERDTMTVILPIPGPMQGAAKINLSCRLTLGGVGTKPESEIVMWFHQLIVTG